jgi:hypothetical protein
MMNNGGVACPPDPAKKISAKDRLIRNNFSVRDHDRDGIFLAKSDEKNFSRV